jgi:hypothetical protein
MSRSLPPSVARIAEDTSHQLASPDLHALRHGEGFDDVEP